MTLISHRKKPIVNAAHEPAKVIHPGDHSNKLISMINASLGMTQIDVCFLKKKVRATFEERRNSQHYFFITKPWKVESDTPLE